MAAASSGDLSIIIPKLPIAQLPRYADESLGLGDDIEERLRHRVLTTVQQQQQQQKQPRLASFSPRFSTGSTSFTSGADNPPSPGDSAAPQPQCLSDRTAPVRKISLRSPKKLMPRSRHEAASASASSTTSPLSLSSSSSGGKLVKSAGSCELSDGGSAQSGSRLLLAKPDGSDRTRPSSAQFAVGRLERARSSQDQLVVDASTPTATATTTSEHQVDGEYRADDERTPLILLADEDGFYLESAANRTTPVLVNKTPGLRWFARHFMSTDDYFLGVGKHAFLGVLVVMYKKLNDGQLRTIYMNQMGIECRLLDGQHKPTIIRTKATKRDWQQRLMRKISPSLVGADCQLLSGVAASAQIEEKLLSLTTMHPSELVRLDVLKVGVVCLRDGMADQRAVFLHSDVSPAYAAFLDLLGRPHPTSDAARYRGGLTPADGASFLAAEHRSLEIAFHVNQWIQPADLQSAAADAAERSERLYLLRKRHIANDSVVVVFHEASTPFDPALIKTGYTQIYVVVQPSTSSSSAAPGPAVPYYRLAICAKEGVQPWHPSFPQLTRLRADAAFRDFLLDKLVAGQRACYVSSVFQKRFVKSRTLLLEEIWSMASAAHAKP